MENISRRTFLKTAGASVLAVGAVSMLGGCGIVDNIVTSMLKKYSDVPNAKVMNSMVVIAGNSVGTLNAANADSKITGLMIDAELVNANTKKVTLKKSNFTLKVDGADATVLTGSEATKMLSSDYSDYLNEYVLLDNKGELNLAPVTDPDGKYYAAGVLVFKLKTPVASWKKAELTVTVGSNKAVYTITNSGNGDVKTTVK